MNIHCVTQECGFGVDFMPEWSPMVSIIEYPLGRALKMSGMFSSGWRFMKIVARIDDPFEIPKLQTTALLSLRKTNL